jgi:hypothetical protein
MLPPPVRQKPPFNFRNELLLMTPRLLHAEMI